MFKTEKADWAFIVRATLVWLAGLAATAQDFRQAWRRRTFRFGDCYREYRQHTWWLLPPLL